ncbi:SDR family NAD(P)-dependent oxidoreductase [Simkania negevensis]|uniref:SDR family NAD(P)-dependent oxidoreductase n=1 Tax=Simkania negevensis TaxID=83561 RepID=A0ABS3ASU5_9BACT|nr:SDR family NAD(P)-dependent oxidoreductase [Simkania negevensis]
MRTALVTGGNRGIGFEACRQLAYKGIQVFLGSRDMSAGEKAAMELKNSDGEVIPVQLDVSKKESIQNVQKDIGKEIDILVNNAGALFQESILEGNAESFEDSWRIHVLGPLQLAQQFMPGMNKRQYGRIVNVSSAWRSFAEGLGGPAPYSITKAALNAMTIKLAEEAIGDVKINSMCPGWVRTSMGGASAPRTPEEGADTIVWLATLDANGPNGGFFRNRQPIDW